MSSILVNDLKEKTESKDISDLATQLAELRDSRFFGLLPRRVEVDVEEFVDAASSHLSSPEKRERVERLLPAAFNSRGLLRYLRVEFDEAVEDFSSAIELNPVEADYYYNRALVRYRLQDFCSARCDATKALQLNPRHDSARLCLRSIEEFVREAATPKRSEGPLLIQENPTS